MTRPGEADIAPCANPLASTPAADRVLVIRMGALGDVARTVPAVSALRRHYREAMISWLIESPSADLIASQTCCDEVIVFPRSGLNEALRRGRWLTAMAQFRQFALELRRRRFDLVIDFHAILKTGLLARLSGAPVRVSYEPPVARELAWAFANRRARVEPSHTSRYERNAALVEFLGIDSDELPRAPLRADRPAAVPGSARAVIHPGSSLGTPYKRYPVESFAIVARGLLKELGMRSLVTRGVRPDELALAQAIVDGSGGAAELAPETRELSDLLCLFVDAPILIGSDTGPLHIASLVGTPVVQLVGPTDPVQNAPYSETASRSLRVPMPCSPCRRGCAAASCMSALAPKTVIEAARELLAETDGSYGSTRAFAGP